MLKINIILLIFIIFLSISLIKSKTNLIDDVLDDYDIKYEEYLKKFFLNYINNNNLISSDKLL